MKTFNNYFLGGSCLLLAILIASYSPQVQATPPTPLDIYGALLAESPNDTEVRVASIYESALNANGCDNLGGMDFHKFVYDGPISQSKYTGCSKKNIWYSFMYQSGQSLDQGAINWHLNEIARLQARCPTTHAVNTSHTHHSWRHHHWTHRTSTTEVRYDCPSGPASATAIIDGLKAAVLNHWQARVNFKSNGTDPAGEYIGAPGNHNAAAHAAFEKALKVALAAIIAAHDSGTPAPGALSAVVANTGGDVFFRPEVAGTEQCAILQVAGNQRFFVPLNTENDWESFLRLNGHPNVTVVDCIGDSGDVTPEFLQLATIESGLIDQAHATANANWQQYLVSYNCTCLHGQATVSCSAHQTQEVCSL